MQTIIPAKLQVDDLVRVIAPARSLAMIGLETRTFANQHLQDLGLKVSFGAFAEEKDDQGSSSVEHRVADLHQAFLDPKVKAIFTVIGGWNSNQLLRSIDWEILRQHPKILCGYSDITALQHAIFTKTGLVTYSGPHYSTLGQKQQLEYTLEYLKKCLFQTEPFDVLPSPAWTDDLWFLDQDKRNLIPNTGYWRIQQGKARGQILGANLGTLNLLAGTGYYPELQDSILFLEDTGESKLYHLDRELESLTQKPSFKRVQGIVFGRCQPGSEVTEDKFRAMIQAKKALKNLPVLANVDFGHTEPRITYPIGGTVELEVASQTSQLRILEH